MADCPSTFTHIASVGGCYKLVNRNLNWDDAGLACRSLHGDAHLVVINDDQEQSAVASLASNSVSIHSLHWHCSHTRPMRLLRKGLFNRMVYDNCLSVYLSCRPLQQRAADLLLWSGGHGISIDCCTTGALQHGAAASRRTAARRPAAKASSVTLTTAVQNRTHTC